MSLENNLTSLVSKIGEDVGALKQSIGNLDELQTTNKTSLEEAITEIQSDISNLNIISE